MKILSVTFTNINSLIGTTTIDFTDPGFDAGVFLITGPTGSGKTTTLDAITLALFGRTGRQKSITGGAEGANEAMNRDTGFCSSAVDFIGVDGKRYRATWSQTRARQKVDGRLQAVKRSLVALDDGERDISEHKMTDTAALISRTLGFSFEEFTRTVILEQGQFDSFLKASEKDRGDILEKATRTARFSKAGRAIFAAYQRAEKARDDAQAAFDHLGEGILGEESLAELAGRLESLRTEKTRLAADQDRLSKLRDWLREDASLLAQGEKLRAEREAFDAAAEEARARALSLGRAKKARGADVAHAEAKGARRASEGARATVSRQLEEIDRLKARLPQLQEKAAEAVRDAAAARSEKEGRDRVVLRARELDGRIREVRATIASSARSLADSRGRREKIAGELVAATEKGERSERLVLFADRYRAEGGPVPAEFAGCTVVRAIDGWRKASMALREEEASLRPLEEAAAEAERRFAIAAAEWPSLLEALDGCVDRAEQVVHQAGIVASLSDHRARLVEGEPCPLCGATSHPYGRPGVHVEALDEAKRKLDEAKAKRETARKRHEGLRDAAQQARRRHDQAAVALERSRTDLSKAEGSVEREIGAIRSAREAFAEDRKRLEQGLAEAADDERKRSEEARVAAEPLPALEEERKGIPFADPEAEARRLQQLVADRTAAEARAEQVHLAAKEAFAKAARTLEENEAIAREKAGAALAADAAFQEMLAAGGFPDEAGWRAARLEDPAFISLERTVSARSAEASALAAREEDHGKALALHGEARPDDLLPAEEVDGRLEAIRGKSEEIARSIGGIDAQLERNRADEDRRRKAHEQLVAATVLADKWKNLNRWLGGMDGKNFRVYAQGRTLDRLLTAASPHLATMSGGRFSFQWNPGAGTLEPEIVDHYLADEARPVSNLSGGETFMVSLALTLGLSGLSGDRFSVGSLFLDEGFGTLDGQCLDLALTTLSKLNSKGCLVGIISHVEAVKECIPDRIEVKRTGPGVSVASGIGVTTGPARS